MLMHNHMQIRRLFDGRQGVALFLGLYLGHILGDFVFQPGRLVLAKREHRSAAVLHSGIVALCAALALAGVLRSAWPAVVAAGIAHLGVERLSIGARRAGRSKGLTVFLLDQGLHIVSLVMIALVLDGDVPPVIGIWPVSVEFLAMVCGLGTVAFAGSILVFEVQLAGDHLTGTGLVLRLDGPRLYGMAERALALLIALLAPSPLLGVLAFLPRTFGAIFAAGDSRTRHLTAGSVGLGLTAIAWILVTSVTLTY